MDHLRGQMSGCLMETGKLQAAGPPASAEPARPPRPVDTRAQDGAQNTTQQQAQAQAQPQPQASTAQHSTVPRPVPRTPRRNVTRRNASYRTAKTAEHTHLKRVVRRVFEVDRVLLVDLTARGGGGRALSKAPRVRARERMVGTLAELWTGVGEGIGRPMRGGGKKVDQRDSAACVPVQNCAPTLLSGCLTTAWVPSGGYLSSLCNGAAFLCPTRPSLILLLHHPRPLPSPPTPLCGGGRSPSPSSASWRPPPRPTDRLPEKRPYVRRWKRMERQCT